MSSERYFSYYYGRECEQFSFFRIPKLLISDQYFSNLSAEAKLLYGLMLDRMCLSQRNGWFDEQGRVFIIFPRTEIQRDLHVGKNTASRLANALEECGLIRRVRRGQGLPSLIYVMNFASGERPGEPEYDVDLPEELAQAAGFDSSEEARIAFHGNVSASAVQKEAVNSAISTNRRQGDGCKNNSAMGDEIKNCAKDADMPILQDDSNVCATDSELIRLMPLEKAAGPHKAGAGLTKEVKMSKLDGEFETENKTDVNSGKSFEDLDGRKTSSKQKGSDRDESNPQADSRGLKSNLLDRSAECNHLASSWITPNQKVKNKTSGRPKTRTENNTNINIHNKLSSSISHADNNTRCSDGLIMTMKNRVLEHANPEALPVMVQKSELFSINLADYSEGLNYAELIEATKEKIEYDALLHDFGEKEVSIFPHLIAEMIYICRGKSEIQVGRITYNAEILKQRYLSLTIHHIRHILYTIQENHISPGNIRNYYIQMLYNAPVTTSAYCARRYDYEMYHAAAV